MYITLLLVPFGPFITLHHLYDKLPHSWRTSLEAIIDLYVLLKLELDNAD